MKTIFVLAALLLSLPALAEDAAPGELLSRYWLEEPLTLGATVGLPSHLFSLSGSGTGKDKNLDFSPPQATDLTLTGGYGPFQFSYKLPVPQSAYSRSTYGRVSYTDFSFEFGRDRLAASVYYQDFSGFYTDLNGNTGNFSRVGPAEPDTSASTSASSSTTAPPDILQRPDIRTRHYGAVAWHSVPLKGEGDQAFKISFHTIYGKPDPGFNLDLVNSLFYDRAQAHADFAFVPAAKAATFGNGASLTGVDSHSAGAGVGLASSYVFESGTIFLDGLFLYGGGVQRQLAEYVSDHRWRTAYVDNVNLRTGVNYRGDHSQAGFHFWVNTLGSPVGDVRFNSSNLALELSYLRTI
ncbi:MAG: hypothetical protein ACXVB9_20890 [Bdellovibrionota bacterium]